MALYCQIEAKNQYTVVTNMNYDFQKLRIIADQTVSCQNKYVFTENADLVENKPIIACNILQEISIEIMLESVLDSHHVLRP